MRIYVIVLNIFLICLFIFPSKSAAIQKTTNDKIDSLLVVNNLDLARNICNSDSSLLGYNKLIDQFIFLQQMKQEKKNKYIETYKSQFEQYKEKYAGKIASNYFSTFLEKLNQRKENESLRYLFLARFYRSNFMMGVQENFKIQLSMAKMHYKNGEIDNAKHSIQMAEELISTKAIMHHDVESFNILHSKIYLKEKQNSLIQELYNSDKLISYSWMISTSSKFVFYGIKNNTLKYIKIYTDLGTVDYLSEVIQIDQSAVKTSFGQAIEIQKSIMKKLTVYSAFELGFMKYETRNSNSKFTSDFDINYYDYTLGLQYRFTENAGLRYFGRLGIGKSWLEIDEKKYDNGRIIYNTNIIYKQSFTDTHITSAFGVEFIDNKFSHFPISFSIGNNFSISEQTRISQLLIYFNLSIGFGFF